MKSKHGAIWMKENINAKEMEYREDLYYSDIKNNIRHSVDEDFVTVAQELEYLNKFGDNIPSVIIAFNQLQENYKNTYGR